MSFPEYPVTWSSQGVPDFIKYLRGEKFWGNTGQGEMVSGSSQRWTDPLFHLSGMDPAWTPGTHKMLDAPSEIPDSTQLASELTEIIAHMDLIAPFPILWNGNGENLSYCW